MTLVLILYVFVPLAVFLLTAALSRVLTNAGQLRLTVGFLIGLVVLSACFHFGLVRDRAPSDTDIFRFMMLWLVLLPAVTGAVIGILAGWIQKVSGGL